MCVFVCTDGIEFFWSENGVLLTSGDAEGKLLPKYFSRALRLRPTSKKHDHTQNIQLGLFLMHQWIKVCFMLQCSRSHPVFQEASCHSSSSRGNSSVIGHGTAHLTALCLANAGSHGNTWQFLVYPEGGKAIQSASLMGLQCHVLCHYWEEICSQNNKAASGKHSSSLSDSTAGLCWAKSQYTLSF